MTTTQMTAPPMTVADDATLRVEEMRVAFSGTEVLHGVSIGASRGDVLGLIGPSGCGKTTLLRCLNRLTELSAGAAVSGRVLLEGTDIYAPGENLQGLRRRIGMVFQQPNPFPMTIRDNIAYAIREPGVKPGRAELAERVELSLRGAGLWNEVKDALDRPALSLSGGQQQRLCIARALAAEPDVLLMDEPCSALDPIATAIIEDLIARLKKYLAVVVVTHNLGQARRIATSVAFMYLGDIVEWAPVDRLFDDPQQARTRDYVTGAFG